MARFRAGETAMTMTGISPSAFWNFDFQTIRFDTLRALERANLIVAVRRDWSGSTYALAPAPDAEPQTQEDAR
jgi:hypothetical protein